MLAAQQSHDAAMLYISDHGESLGEQGMYLHGLPWLIAPSEQSEVPMVLWLSSGFAASRQIDIGCLRAYETASLSHDYLFHTLLGLLDVRAQVYQPDFDFTTGCRKAG
jgi:lipid A ethanolaminephosphotransferase